MTTETEYEDILYEVKDQVARITINRPERYNACRHKTYIELQDAFLRAADDSSVGVVVFTGAGDKAFCAGGDLKDDSAFDWGGRRVILNEAWRRCLKPIIAAVNGFCIGGGNVLNSMCDLTIAVDTARFGQVGPKVGSPAAGFDPMVLTTVVGQKKAREIWYLCRQYTAEEARKMGLVNWVVPKEQFEAEIDKVCQEILSKSPTVIRLLKYSFDSVVDYMRPYIDVELVESWIAPGFTDTEESKEGVSAFLEKRPPDYKKYRTAKEAS